LRGAGYEVLTTASAKEALRIAAGSPLDAAIIELTLPDGDGLALCRRLRELSKMPILFLSAVDEPEQKIGALRAGADDYITKPFNPLEVLARLEAVLRRVQRPARDEVISGAGLEVDLRAHVVRRNGEEVRLTPTEFELLAVLARNHGRLLTHRELVTAVWGSGSGDHSQALRTHIARLRRKLEPDETVQYICTEPGVGFRLDLEAITRVA
jgi:two-component system KDP operon response regulator KdpE